MPPLSDNADQIIEHSQSAAAVEIINGTDAKSAITDEAATLRANLQEGTPSEADTGMSVYYAWADREYPSWREVKK